LIKKYPWGTDLHAFARDAALARLRKPAGNGSERWDSDVEGAPDWLAMAAANAVIDGLLDAGYTITPPKENARHDDLLADMAAKVKLLAVEADLVFTDEQDYQQAIALGLVCLKAGCAAAEATAILPTNQSRDGETS
jgi:hypothetical protein